MNIRWRLIADYNGHKAGSVFYLQKITMEGWLMHDKNGNNVFFKNVEVLEAD